MQGVVLGIKTCEKGLRLCQLVLFCSFKVLFSYFLFCFRMSSTLALELSSHQRRTLTELVALLLQLMVSLITLPPTLAALIMPRHTLAARNTPPRTLAARNTRPPTRMPLITPRPAVTAKDLLPPSLVLTFSKSLSSNQNKGFYHFSTEL